MKQNANRILGISSFLLATTFISCVDFDKNLFNSEKVKEEYFTWAISVPNFSLWATTGGRNEAYAEWYKNGKDEFIFK